MYIRTEIDNSIANTTLSGSDNQTETDDIDNELPTLILNTYNKSDIDTFFTDYYNIGYLNTQFG